MIVKKLKRTSFKKSKSTMIGGLVDYILAEHDDRGKDKLAYAGSRNFLTTTVAAQKREMISLAEESIQSRMPVTHWILSWQENEQPSREQVDEAVSLFLRGMGLAEHQTIYALHKNTGNYHLHIAVNRTHPYTQKVIQPHRGFDIEAAHKIVAEIEHKQGWASQMDFTCSTRAVNARLIPRPLARTTMEPSASAPITSLIRRALVAMACKWFSRPFLRNTSRSSNTKSVVRLAT